nr:zinc-binding dehydrogenase [Friedmanniella luteola]
MSGRSATPRGWSRAAPSSCWAAAASGCRWCRARGWRGPAGSSPSTCGPDKTALARTLGATDVVDAAAGDTVEAVRALLPDGADYAFDAIGGPALTEQCVAVLGMGGAAVVVGIPPAGVRAAFDPGTLVAREQRILGSTTAGSTPRATSRGWSRSTWPATCCSTRWSAGGGRWRRWPRAWTTSRGVARCASC